MQEIYQQREKQYQATLEIAKLSPCVRRKYGASAWPNGWEFEYTFFANNQRVSKCCNDGCIRDIYDIKHGMNTDIGAEVHAEQALVVALSEIYGSGIFMIAGLDRKGLPLYGIQCWPCYSCARIIKVAGINEVWVKEDTKAFQAYSIDEILEHYEREFIGVGAS